MEKAIEALWTLTEQDEAFVEELAQKHTDPIDYLILNAGILKYPNVRTHKVLATQVGTDYWCTACDRSVSIPQHLDYPFPPDYQILQ